MSQALEIVGFDMGDPTDASDATGALETTVIYYDPAQPAAQPVAESVNTAMGGGATVLPLPSGTPPVQNGDIGGAGVLVMLGVDKANKTLEELNPSASTAPVVVTNPPLTTARIRSSTTPDCCAKTTDDANHTPSTENRIPNTEYRIPNTVLERMTDAEVKVPRPLELGAEPAAIELEADVQANGTDG